MIRAWLARRADAASLIDRVAALEHELSETRATILSLNDRMVSTEMRGTAASAAHDRLDRQLRVLARVARAGTARLRRVQAASIDQAARDEGIRETLDRLDAAIAIAGTRIDAEAEQARRGTMGLFHAIEALRERRA